MNNSTQKNCTIDNMNAFERGVKRAFDMIGALLGLIILSPVFLIIYVMQKIEGEGPAIFSQDRIGKGGKPFKIYKFRTMIVESELDGPCLAQKDDDRLTSVGRFLRAYHLDELPQLWNVFIGDMSFVGYRPQTLDGWFYNFTNLTGVQGIRYIDAADVTSTALMFSNCGKLTDID